MSAGHTGRPPVLKGAIADFVQALASLEGEALRRRCMEELSGLTGGQYKPNTARSYISRYRSAISETYGKEHPALAIFVPVSFLSDEDGEASCQTKPPSRQEAVEHFVRTLAGAEGREEYQLLWEEELRRLDDLSDNTKKFYISRYYRPAFLQMLGKNHPAMEVLRLPVAMSEGITKQYRHRVIEQNRSLVHVPQWRELVQAAMQSARYIIEQHRLDDESMVMLGAALLLLTGRRPYEIFCSGVFERASLRGGAARSVSKWSVLFSGQAKTRGRAGTSFANVQEIPVLAPSSLILHSMQLLRMSPLGLRLFGVGNTLFSKLTSSRGREDGVKLRHAVQTLYRHLWPDSAILSPKCLRALYAEIAWHVLAGPAISKNSFFARILGHSAHDLVTSLSYMDYYLEKLEQAAAIWQRQQKRVEQQQRLYQAESGERNM